MNQGNQQVNKNHNKIDIICHLLTIIKPDSLSGIKKIKQIYNLVVWKDYQMMIL